jgi:hypothetical protein
VKVLLVCALLLCAAASAGAQVTSVATTAPTPDATPTPQGSINGRVVADDGQPLAGVTVYAQSLHNQYSAGGSDTEGKFTLKNLARGAYTLNAFLAGYYDPTRFTKENGARIYYRPGEAVTIKLSKGGVITGRVRDANGEPLIAVRVRAIMLRDAEGRTLGEPGFGAGPAERTTDDRGVYRIYGLPPGVYVVAAGGKGAFDYNRRVTAYDDDAPTYYPATTRDGAAEVILQSGQEAADIDIRYRGEPGHAVSGAVEGGAGEGALNILLTAAGSPLLEGFRYFSNNDNASFVFDGLADGDYDLVARRIDQLRDKVLAATTMRVSVHGADVTGVRLTLAPLATIAGRVVLEAAPPNSLWRPQCQTKLDANADETIILARPADNTRRERAQPGGPRVADTAPDGKGDFTLHGLVPGRFRLDLRPPNADWYVRVVTLIAAPSANAKPSTSARAANINPLTDELSLSSGTQLNGLTFTLAPGAAALGGHVAAATTGAALPELQVYLVPTERERVDDVLRYPSAPVRNDGTFAFNNLAPGRYYLLARPIPPQAARSADAAPPFFPDAQTRAQLRRAAEATNALDLQPCQRLSDYVLRYAPKD